jgi:hypothetical protein
MNIDANEASRIANIMFGKYVDCSFEYSFPPLFYTDFIFKGSGNCRNLE